jgi:ABC-type nitrate/sulfonate/bicarbonate transport system substrate-binding protein
MNFRNFIKKCLLCLLVGTSLISCQQESPKLKLVYPNKVNYESFIIAKHLGYFGAGIEVITVKSGIHAAEAMTIGDADIAAMGDGPSVILLSRKKECSIITRYAKGHKIHRLISQKDIHSPLDLKGKKIGIQIGSSTHAAFYAWLKSVGISEKEIELVPMNPSNMPEAMKSRQLDAMAGSEPWGLNVEKLCRDDVHELANLSNSDSHSPHLLLVKNDAINAKEVSINQVIEALSKVNTFIAENPEKAAEIAAHYIGLDVGDEEVCMARLKWELGWEESDLRSVLNTADFFLKSKKIKKLPAFENRLHILKD